METQINHIERFLKHTELYMQLTGKDAQKLSASDMDKVVSLIRMQQETEDNAGHRRINS